MDIKQLTRQYAQLDKKEKMLSKAKEECREKLKGIMTKQQLDKLESRYGQFTLFSAIKWTYSEKVKKLQALEQKKGIAVANTFQKFQFTPNK